MLSFFKRGAGGASAVSPADFVARRGKEDIVLDVRTPGEFADGHLGGAQNIDLHSRDFRSRIDALDRDKTYYVYCRSGARSGSAVRMMREMGFERAYNAGGIGALARAGASIA